MPTAAVQIECLTHCLVLGQAEKHMHFPRCRSRSRPSGCVARFFLIWRSCRYNLIAVCRPTRHQEKRCRNSPGAGKMNYNCAKDQLLARSQLRDTNSQKFLHPYIDKGAVSKLRLMVHLLCASIRLAARLICWMLRAASSNSMII